MVVVGGVYDEYRKGQALVSFIKFEIITETETYVSFIRFLTIPYDSIIIEDDSKEYFRRFGGLYGQ